MIPVEEAVEKLKRLGFHCQQCGNCCLELGGNLTLNLDEAKIWDEFEDFVFSNFGYYYPSDFMEVIPELGCADLWFHPETGEELHKCPFIRRQKKNYRCLINDLKPSVCKIFPIVDTTGEFGERWADICPEVRRITQK